MNTKSNLAYLNVESLSKRWSNNDMALEDISFIAEPGKLIALIGPSGSGKSTLLRVIAGLEVYDSGRIQRPNGRVGMVFQEPSLWPHLSLIDNVSLPLWSLQGRMKSEARTIAEEILIAWGLENRLQAFPPELSGGQQQRGALARTLVMNPKIICLDEVTSALDPEITADILLRLLALKQTNTIVLITTHHLGFAKEGADHLIFMDHGRIVEQGAASKVLGNPQKDRTKRFVEAAKLS